MSRCEGLARQVFYPVTELIVTRRDEAALFTVKAVTDCESCFGSIAMRWKVWGLQPIPQEEVVMPLLGPQLCDIDCGRQHREPVPGLCRPSHSTCLQDQGYALVLLSTPLPPVAPPGATRQAAPP